MSTRRALPLGIERTESARTGPSGSAGGVGRHAQARVAVRRTLPLGIERTESVRTGPSGSVLGALGCEWQCSSHCHSAVNVRGWNVQARVAVQLSARSGVGCSTAVRSSPSGSAGGVGRHAQARVAVRRTLPLGIERTESARTGPSGSVLGALGCEWQCNSHCAPETTSQPAGVASAPGRAPIVSCSGSCPERPLCRRRGVYLLAGGFLS